MKLVKNLILEIVDFLEKNLETKSEIKILKSIKDISLREDNFGYHVPNFPPKERELYDDHHFRCPRLSPDTRSDFNTSLLSTPKLLARARLRSLPRRGPPSS